MSEINDILKPFRITIEHYGEKVTVEKPRSDLSTDEFLDMFKRAAFAVGFDLKDYFDE